VGIEQPNHRPDPVASEGGHIEMVTSGTQQHLWEGRFGATSATLGAGHTPIEVDHGVFVSEEEKTEDAAWDRVFLAHAALGSLETGN